MTRDKTGPAPLTRRELVGRLQARLGLSAREAGEVLDDFLEILAAQLAAGGTATLSGLGRFDTRFSPSRLGRDLGTGRPVLIPARWRPVFNLSPSLRRRLEPEQDPDGD